MSVGIIGFGHWAQNYHAPALRSMRRSLEICVADPLENSRAAAMHSFPGIRTYADYRHMLEKESLHAVLVAAPPSKHLQIWRSVSRLNLPVFMEKPFLLAHELDEIDEYDPAWKQLMINFNRRYWPAYQSLERCISDGALGPIRQARFTLHIDTRKWSEASNHRARPDEGGVLYDLGSHMLDLALHSFQQSPVGISARRAGAGVKDQRVELQLRYAAGFTVEIDLAYGRRNQECAIVEGEKATWRLRDPNYLCWLESRRSVALRLRQSAADYAVLGFRGLFRHQSMMRYSVGAALNSFFDSLAVSRPFVPGFDDALRVAVQARAAQHDLAESLA